MNPGVQKPHCEPWNLTIASWTGCAKINLQIRNDNKEAVEFYHKQGYKDDAVVSLGKRLILD